MQNKFIEVEAEGAFLGMEKLQSVMQVKTKKRKNRIRRALNYRAVLINFALGQWGVPKPKVAPCRNPGLKQE